MTIKVFLDCEFTEFEQPKLISLALVTEDNDHSFYAELTDTYLITDCSEFVVNTVLPLLDAKLIKQPLIDYTHVHAQMTFDECRFHLMKWLEKTDAQLSIYNDAPHFDFSLLSNFFTEKWPDRLSLYCETIVASTIDGQERYDKTTLELFENGFRQHHSLDDAKVMSKAYQAMKIADANAPSSQYIMNIGIMHLINRKIPKK